jgi:hypothetical protein
MINVMGLLGILGKNVLETCVHLLFRSPALNDRLMDFHGNH